MALSDEIIGGAVSVYVAPKDTAEPDVGDDEAALLAADWILIGAQGAKNITEDGVRIINEDVKNLWRGLGSTAPQKSFVVSEDARVEFEMADLTIENLAHAFGGEADSSPSTITTTAAAAGVSGSKSIPMLRGFDRNEVALLIRKNDSPYNIAMGLQWWIPRVMVDSNLEITWVKGEPALVPFSYVLLESPTNGFGRITAQTAVPTS